MIEAERLDVEVRISSTDSTAMMGMTVFAAACS